MGKKNKNKSSKGNAFSSAVVIIIIIAGVILLGMMYFYQKNKELEIKDYLAQLNAEDEAEEESEEESESALIEEIESDYSFYEKLSAGYDVNILVIGDSTGAGSGASSSENRWYNLLSSYLEETYMDGTEFDGDITVTNISVSGGTAYSGYVRLSGFDDGLSYDLAIICCGENDTEETFAQYFEALVRMVTGRYEGISVIAVLESSQLASMDISYMDGESENELSDESYTAKMTAINEICAYYGLQTADTIAAFVNSGYSYDELSDDGVYPNDTGQQVYLDAIADVIAENVEAGTGKTKTGYELYTEGAAGYENYAWYTAEDPDEDEEASENAFVLSDGTVYTLTLSDEDAIGEVCTIGIDYSYISGDNYAEIYIDGELYRTLDYTYGGDSSLRHIQIIGTETEVGSEISVVFASEEEAEGFNGICISWE